LGFRGKGPVPHKKEDWKGTRKHKAHFRKGESSFFVQRVRVENVVTYRETRGVIIKKKNERVRKRVIVASSK